MTQGISKMLNQYAADHYLTFPVQRRLFLFQLIHEIAQPDVGIRMENRKTFFANSHAFS